MDIQEIIKQRYQELPEDIKRAIKSTDLATKFKNIADKHSLHIDQNGTLQTETILVMLGLEPTEDYVENIQRNVEVSRTEALSVAEDVNSEILDKIKNSLRSFQEQSEIEETPTIETPPPPNESLSSLERAGQFTIEKPPTSSSSPLYKEENLNKEAILKGIEDPAISMIDHLLTTPVQNTAKVEEKKPEKTVEKKPYTSDPYREQI